MQAVETVEKDLVLIGGGHSHVAVLRAFGMRPEPGVRLTVIARDVHTPYSGMLPGLIAGHYAFEDAHIDLRPLCAFAGARLFHAEAMGLDLERRQVACRDRPPVAYDLLSIDIGSSPRMADAAGATDNAIPVKPIDGFLARWDGMVERLAARRGSVSVGVVGGGAGGVELLLSAEHRLRAMQAAGALAGIELSFHLLTADATILASHNDGARARFRRELADRGVSVHTECRVTAVAPGRVHCADGRSLGLDEILWVTNAAAAAWPGRAGLAVDDAGFIRVDASLRSLSHPDVFAAGDIAAVADHPRPKSGVFAVRQGPPLAANLRHVLRGEAPRPFRPQRRFLSLISTGDARAVASRGAWSAQGAWVWTWKDWIDRRFMRRYADLPEMKARPAPQADAQDAMRCGGCGAKVGPDVLHRALARLDRGGAAGVDVGLADSDDAAVLAVPPGKLLVQSTDGFRAFLSDPYVFAQVATNHALGDLFAMGATPWTALATVTLPFGRDDKTGELLYQVMAGVQSVLAREGAALVGGHSAEGAELSVGVTVNGLAPAGAYLRKGGLAAGDALVLTKPLGTGVLFAADMRGKAKGRWIAAALRSMTASHATAAAILRDHGATACTDVTGFGLAGHLGEMLRASGRSAEIDLPALPLLDGALQLAAAGIESTLLPQNLMQARNLRDASGRPPALGPRERLMFDPQTAGGLLAGIPAARAGDCVSALRQAGHVSAAVVGRVAAVGGVGEIRLVAAETS